jgi:amino acid transporter
LFAYDAFLNASQLSEKTKGGTKTVSKVVLIGMIFITVIYSLVALASILHSQGTVEGLLKDSLSKSSAKILGIFV